MSCPTSRFPRRAGALTATAVAAVLVAAGCSSRAPVSRPPSPGPGSIVKISTGVNPAGVSVGEGFAWIANSGEGTVSKVDLHTNRPVAKIVVGSPQGLVGCESRSVHQTPHGDFRIRNCDLPKAVATSKGAVWAGRGDNRSLVRIDPASDRVVADIPVGVEPWYIAASDTAVWLTDWRTNTVVRVDPATNRVVATIPNLPAGTTGLTITPDAVWVASSRDNALNRIDSRTNQVTGSLPTDPTPLPVLYAYGSVWVHNEFSEGNGTVERIDPAANRVVATIPVGPNAGRDGLDSLAAADGGVWVAGLLLERIDPATNQVDRHLNHTCNAVTAGAGALWTVDIAYSVSRITP